MYKIPNPPNNLLYSRKRDCMFFDSTDPVPENAMVVPGFPCYAVSKDGESLYSCRLYGSKLRRLGPWWKMKPKFSSCIEKKRPYFDLFVEVGKPERFFLHQLVMMTFVGPCPAGLECCHENDDPMDNRLENLYYGTKRDNMEDAIRNGLLSVGEDSTAAKLTNAQVLACREEWDSQEFTYQEKRVFLTKWSDALKVRKHYIRRLVKREIWKRI